MKRARNKGTGLRRLSSRELSELTPSERIQYKRRLREEEEQRAKEKTTRKRTTASAIANRSGSGDGNKQKKAKRKLTLKGFLSSKCFAYCVIGLCAAIVLALGIGAGMYAAISNEIANKDFDALKNNFSTIVYGLDKDGNAVEVEYLHSNGNREWIESDQIPDIAKKAAVSIEDERFYSHKGIDFKRTMGAVIGWFGEKLTGGEPSYGGSTITQQLIKNITNEKDRTVLRKVKEMMRATALEKRFEKDDILTMYLNVVYFGNQCYGIESASKIYYGKSAKDLTLPEAAMIVGITQAPSRFDPFRNPDNALEKRNTVLSKMYELKAITEEEYNAAVNSPLGVNETRATMNSSIYSYFVDQVITDVLNDLQTKKGYSREFASQEIFNGGLKIYTTMDPSIQTAMEEVYTNKANFPLASSGVQSAMVIMDPYNGQIKAMVGGIGEKVESRGLNRATQTFRQPGSSIKPISVYAPSLEAKKITAATILTDAPLTIGDWSPHNSYSGYKGDMSVRKAIEISANIPAVKTLQTLGVSESYNFMTNKLHFSSIIPADKAISPLSLGGLTKGVSTKEMAAAYAIFPNKGIYTTPHTYTKVLDSDGTVLLEYKPESNRAISEANAYIMTSFLREVVNGSAGTGGRARLSGITAYGKTGSSNDHKDKWFVGFTGNYVGATWYGYEDYEKSVGSSNIAATVWKLVMQKAHQGVQLKTISQPSGVTAVSICQVTGKLSGGDCTNKKTEYFASGTVPADYCTPMDHFVDTPPVDITDDPTASPDVTVPPTTAPTVAPTVAPSVAPSGRPAPNDDVITLD